MYKNLFCGGFGQVYKNLHQWKFPTIRNAGRVLYMYRIVGNFRGWKCSRISRFESHPWKFSPQNFRCAIPNHDWFSIPRKFSPQNVHFLPIRESFLSRKFPSIQYILQWTRRNPTDAPISTLLHSRTVDFPPGEVNVSYQTPRGRGEGDNVTFKVHWESHFQGGKGVQSILREDENILHHPSPKTYHTLHVIAMTHAWKSAQTHWLPLEHWANHSRWQCHILSTFQHYPWRSRRDEQGQPPRIDSVCTARSCHS